ncbi:MAG: hypothetical protein A3H97_14535 [Acidobacteria bacterium RIFCSPLOWO2_02_FULL_65_29]|nr:MAG: hypothetical protein A3H97_14535 [Acidobacteria bacterium RIFCSPLOWO2_02_FULL_65_29]
MADAAFKVNKKGTLKSVVRPPSATVNPGDDVVIHNKTTKDIWVRMPGGLFVGEPDPFVYVVPASDKKDKKLVDPVPAPALGAHDFQIFVLETFSFATGSSDPEFIIE